MPPNCPYTVTRIQYVECITCAMSMLTFKILTIDNCTTLVLHKTHVKLAVATRAPSIVIGCTIVRTYVISP